MIRLVILASLLLAFYVVLERNGPAGAALALTVGAAVVAAVVLGLMRDA
ncbi:MAG TPA: hypothetical protein VM434_06490 [Beijerinckiaceae bacterium]|nr:hypothetical protein [Beijerinckiaceae bacterium]